MFFYIALHTKLFYRNSYYYRNILPEKYILIYFSTEIHRKLFYISKKSW